MWPCRSCNALSLHLATHLHTSPTNFYDWYCVLSDPILNWHSLMLITTAPGPAHRRGENWVKHSGGTISVIWGWPLWNNPCGFCLNINKLFWDSWWTCQIHVRVFRCYQRWIIFTVLIDRLHAKLVFYVSHPLPLGTLKKKKKKVFFSVKHRSW